MDYTRSHTDIVFGICIKNEDTTLLVGTCGLHHINWVNRCATIGIAIGINAYREKRIGTHAFELLVHYAFESMNLHRISSNALANNARSIALHKHIGFVQEGTRQKIHFKNGTYIDEVIFGLLREQWRNTSNVHQS